MEKIFFYELTYSVDEKVTGSVRTQIIDFVDPENNSRERTDKYQDIYFDFLEDSFDLTKFSGDKNAIATDILYSKYLGLNGLFVSSDFVRLVNNFVTGCCKYRDVYIKYLSEKKDYHFLNLLMCPNIDFKNSIFIVQHTITKEQFDELKLTSEEDFRHSINKIRTEKGASFTIKPRKISLNKKYDLFSYELTGEFLISEELKNAIEKSTLTGYRIKPFDAEFYY
jgi:hypothetical protein